MSWIKKIFSRQKALYFVLFVSFVLRVGYVLTLENKVSWVDEEEYIQLSLSMIEGNGYVNEDGMATAFRPIGYPLFLSGLRLLGFESLFSFRFAQCIVGVATVYLLYLLTILLFSRRAGLLAALFYAIYPYFIFLPGTILASTWFSFILVTATFLFIKGLKLENKTLMAAGGLLLGYATLVRPSALLLIVPVIVWLLINTFEVKKLLRYTAVIVVTFIAVISPWIVRNYSELGILNFSTNGGRNLWLGNNERATPFTGSNISPTKELEQKLHKAKTEVERDHVYNQAALEYIKAHPQQVIKLFFQKAFYFWRWDPSPTTEGYVNQNKLHWWISVLSFGPIFILAIFGFIYSPLETKKMVSLFLLYGIAFTVLHAVYFPKVRFRLPIDLFLMVLAANALDLIFQKLRSLNTDRIRYSISFLKSKFV